MTCPYKHKVHETHLRSVLKGITAKILEITLDFIILDLILQRPAESLIVAIGLESICYALGYLNERGWDKIQWGRQIKNE